MKPAGKQGDVNHVGHRKLKRKKKKKKKKMRGKDKT